jgi:hypothetical protein
VGNSRDAARTAPVAESGWPERQALGPDAFRRSSYRSRRISTSLDEAPFVRRSQHGGQCRRRATAGEVLQAGRDVPGPLLEDRPPLVLRERQQTSDFLIEISAALVAPGCSRRGERAASSSCSRPSAYRSWPTTREVPRWRPEEQRAPRRAPPSGRPQQGARPRPPQRSGRARCPGRLLRTRPAESACRTHYLPAPVFEGGPGPQSGTRKVRCRAAHVTGVPIRFAAG